MEAEVVADGVLFGEGPVWCPDGTLVVTSVVEGRLYRVRPDEGRAEVLADTGGGANGALLASDGSVLVTQNGGLDFSDTGIEQLQDLPPSRPAPPSLQRVHPDGSVDVVTEGEEVGGLHAPNDLCVTADGTVYFTDPGHFPPPDPPIGRVLTYDRDGTVAVHAEDFWFCNGIAVEPGGTLVVVERAGLMRLLPDHSREWVIETLGPGAGDGFCLDEDGRFYVASTVEHGVRVVEPDGSIVEFLEIPGDGLTTNCCFGGDDGRTLFATDAVPGRVVAWEGLPTPGLPMMPWPAV